MLIRIPHCLDHCSPVVGFEFGKCESSKFALLFQDCFGYSAFLAFPYEFWEQLIYFCKEVCWYTYSVDKKGPHSNKHREGLHGRPYKFRDHIG